MRAEQNYENQERKRTSKQKGMTVVLIVSLLVGAIVIVKPRYEASVESDYSETCYDAMYWIGIWYHSAIREKEAAGYSAEEIDYEGLLREVCEVRYAFTLQDDLSSDDFCRAGGHVQMTIDPETHRLSITCRAQGHENYNDEVVTDELLDGMDNIESGIQASE